MGAYERANAIAAYLKERIGEAPDTAIVLGSGLGAFAEKIECEISIPYAEIPDFPRSTVPGHKGVLLVGRVEGKRVLLMQGRFHVYEGYGMEDVTLGVRVFSLLGVKNLILTNAAGAINTAFHPGELMLITDHLSFFCPSPLRGQNDERFGVRFPSMNHAYDAELLQKAREAATAANLTLREGVYIYSQGPMFETPAEIRAQRALGADACGMSTVPEAIVANHCSMRVLGVSCLTNMAAGILDQPLNHQEVIDTGIAAAGDFEKLLREVCRRI